MLSVLIPTRNVVREITASLSALAPQLRSDTEVLVADGSTDGTAELVASAFPWVRLVSCSAGSGLAELRAAALSQSRGKIVAFTDAYCRVNGDWLERLGQEPWHQYAAIGGTVVPIERTRRSDWAAFLCEYGPFLPPLSVGAATMLPANNVAFRRETLERAGLVGEREFWKVFALWRLALRGERFGVDPDLTVHQDRQTSALEFTYHRYLHGRCFGANRARTFTRIERLTRAISCPVLPLLLTARVIRAVHSRPRYRRALWQSLPFAVLFHTAWACGEMHGYLHGSGDACIKLA